MLAGAVRIQTVSYDRNDPSNRTDGAQFGVFKHYLQQHFPLTFRTLKTTVVNQYSLLLEWPGSEASLAPVMWCAHMDVVPVLLTCATPTGYYYYCYYYYYY